MGLAIGIMKEPMHPIFESIVLVRIHLIGIYSRSAKPSGKKLLQSQDGFWLASSGPSMKSLSRLPQNRLQGARVKEMHAQKHRTRP